MKQLTVGIIFAVVFFMAVGVLTGCSRKDKKVMVPPTPEYSDAVVVEERNGQNLIFNLGGKALKETSKVNDVVDMTYDLKKSVYVYLIAKKEDGRTAGNKIEVISQNSRIELNDFFSAEDVKLSPDGDRIAFRSYAGSSIDSVRNISVYDIKSNKYVELKSKVLISGSLYSWLDDSRLIYYGSIPGKQNSTNIYVYDLNSNEESIYFKDINKYCMYFTNIGGNILYMSGIGDDLDLYYYSQERGTCTLVDDNMAKIYGSVKDYRNGYIFFIAEQKNGDSDVYEFSCKSGRLNRITYDFPQYIGVSSGIAEDNMGNIYFTGKNSENSKDNIDIFVYSKHDGSVSLMSTHEGKYRIYGSH